MLLQIPHIIHDWWVALSCFKGALIKPWEVRWRSCECPNQTDEPNCNAYITPTNWEFGHLWSLYRNYGLISMCFLCTEAAPLVNTHPWGHFTVIFFVLQKIKNTVLDETFKPLGLCCLFKTLGHQIVCFWHTGTRGPAGGTGFFLFSFFLPDHWIKWCGQNTE